jgi:hypothetical protein
MSMTSAAIGIPEAGISSFYDPVSTHDDQESDDGRTLAKVIKGLGRKTA